MSNHRHGKRGFTSGLAGLRTDLLAADAPQISIMGTYRFCIVPYDPRDEFALRREVHRLSEELRNAGWNVLSISLQQLLLQRLKKRGPETLQKLIEQERRLFARSPERALQHLKQKVPAICDGTEGIAREIVEMIKAFALKYPLSAERSIIFIGRAGSLYPFFRLSVLLKFIDGHTMNIPVVLLYPGVQKDKSSLSFMGEGPADRDYRPRIYS